MLVPFKNIITIQFSNPIGWTISRLFKSYPSCMIYNIESIEELEKVNLTDKETIILFFFKNSKYFHQWYWEKIARKYGSLSPVLTFGFTNTEEIRYKNRLFSKHRKNYEYLQLPCSLLKLNEYLNELTPIFDHATRDYIDRRCSDNKEQIHGYTHDLKNIFLNQMVAFSEEEIKEIITCFNQIIDNWDNAGIVDIKKENVILEKEKFILNNQFEQTFSFINNIYKIT